MAEFKIPNYAILQCDIPKFVSDEAKIIGTLGNGAIGTVQKVLYNNEEKVVKVLKCNDWDLSGKKFTKEAQIMRKLKHNNVATIEKICLKPLSFLMDYCCIDFSKFGQDVQVHSLDKFLEYVNNFRVKSFEIFFMAIANDIISGLKYLHENKVVHRDIKHANILVSNRHYTTTETEEFQIKKIICKLTDFGEVRSSFIQTQTRFTTSTSDINKGNNLQFYLFISTL